MDQIAIYIEGPQGAGKSLVAHLLWGTLRALGCKVEVLDGGENVPLTSINKAASAGVHKKRPNIRIIVKQH